MRICSDEITLEDLPLQYDHWLFVAAELEGNGRWSTAAKLYRHLSVMFGNVQDMLTREANALCEFGDYAGSLVALGLMTRPTLQSYMIEARCYISLDKPEEAGVMLEKAKSILERK